MGGCLMTRVQAVDVTQGESWFISTLDDPLDVPVPQQAQPGDLLVLWVGRPTWPSSAAPRSTGWTLLEATRPTPVRVLWKVATSADETAGSWSFTADRSVALTATGKTHWRLVVLRGVLSTPVAATGVSTTVLERTPDRLRFGAPSLTTNAVTVVEFASVLDENEDQVRIGTYPSGQVHASPLIGTNTPDAGDMAVHAFDHDGGVTPAREWIAYDIPGSSFSVPGTPTVVSLAIAPNAAPYAPMDLSPVSGATIPPTQASTLRWKFADPDPGDTQSAYEAQWRAYGSQQITTTGEVASPLPQATMPAGLWAEEQQGEWRVRTADADGRWGPWSQWQLFTAASAPDTPDVTSPSYGSSHASSTVTVVWSTPAQDAYRVRSVADVAGQPDPGVVYYDTGVVGEPAVRSVDVPIPVNQRSEWLLVEVQRYGLWSAPAQVLIHVDRTPPPTPTGVQVTPDPAQGALHVAWDPPVAVDPEPSVVAVDVWVDGGPEGLLPVARGHSPNRAFTWLLPTSGVAYRVRVDFIGDNTATASSGWIGSTTAQADYHYGGSYA